MVDAALIFLIASGAVAALQAAHHFVKSTGSARVGRVEASCIKGIVIEDVSCVEENLELFEHTLQVILSSDAIVGVAVGKKSVDKRRLLGEIENRIMTLRVILEKEPGNKSVERKLRLLERIYDRLLNGGEYVEGVVMLLADSCRSREAVDWALSEVKRLGCRAKIVDLERIVEFLAGVRKARLVEVGSIARMVKTSLAVGNVKPLGIYIGRYRDGKPFTIEVWGEGGSLHYLVLGPTGRGKTTLLAAMLLRGDAAGVKTYGIDPKGDLAAYTSHMLRVKRVEIWEVVEGVLRLYREGLVSRDDVIRVFRATGLYLEPRQVDYLVEECVPIDTVLDDVTRRRAARLGISGVTGCSYAPDIDESLVFNLSGLPESLKAPAAAAILAGLLRGKGKRLVVIDEAWRLGRLLEEHIIRLYKEARSRDVSLVAATQDPTDLPLELYNNSYGVFAFGSNDQEYVEKVGRILRLDEREKRVLRGLGVGEALVKLHGRRAEVVEIDAEDVKLPASL